MAPLGSKISSSLSEISEKKPIGQPLNSFVSTLGKFLRTPLFSFLNVINNVIFTE